MRLADVIFEKEGDFLTIDVMLATDYRPKFSCMVFMQDLTDDRYMTWEIYPYTEDPINLRENRLVWMLPVSADKMAELFETSTWHEFYFEHAPDIQTAWVSAENFIKEMELCG